MKTPSKKKTPIKSKLVYVLRTCAADMSAHDGFKWPKKGPVKCPDWKPTAECGHGLHGLLHGEGDGTLLNWSPDAKWLVVAVLEKEVVKIDNGEKVKFPRGTVVFCGAAFEATEFLKTVSPFGKAVVSGTSTSGYRGTSTSGYRGTSTSGYCGTSTSGYCGTSTSGYCGTSTSGDRGTSTSGYCGTSTSGDGGTSTSGYRGTSTSGYCGVLQFSYYDGNRRRIIQGYIGEKGLKADTKYRLDNSGKIIEA